MPTAADIERAAEAIYQVVKPQTAKHTPLRSYTAADLYRDAAKAAAAQLSEIGRAHV